MFGFSESVEQIIVQVSVFLIIALLVFIGRWLRKMWKAIEQIHDMATAVDHAVNSRPESDPTIYELAETTSVLVEANGLALSNLHERFTEHTHTDEVNFADLRSRLGEVTTEQPLISPSLPTES